MSTSATDQSTQTRKKKKAPTTQQPPPTPTSKPPPPPPPFPNFLLQNRSPVTPHKKMSTLGSLTPFDPAKDDFIMWNGTFENFLVANELDPATAKERCVGIFLSSVGITTYTLLVNLLAPTPPRKKTLSELQTALKNHFSPAPQTIAERYKFTKRTQKPGETVNEFMAALRCLAIHCMFGDLEERIRDQLVFGLKSEVVQKQLFAKDHTLTLQAAVAAAVAQETAETSTALIRGPPSVGLDSTEQINKTYSKNPRSNGYNKNKKEHQRYKNQTQTNIEGNPQPHKQKSSSECKGCGSQQHLRSQCPHLHATCHKCGKSGHISKVCRSAPKARTNQLTTDNVIDIRNVKSHNKDLIRLQVVINNHHHNMELDTGCEISVLSEQFWREKLGAPPLLPSSYLFRSYTNNCFRAIGNLRASVEHNGQQVTLDIPVVRNTSLFGRNLLKIIKINWEQVQSQLTPTTVHHLRAQPDELKSLLREFGDIFTAPTVQDRIKGFKARIHLKDDAQPVYLKARTVPYAYRDQVDKALDDMEKNGLISKVETSDWASPLVVVAKPDGRIRLTVDFKNTVNSQLSITRYPIASPDDIFAAVAGGNTFSKIDGSNAYHQIELEEDSKKFLVVNTPRGLYQYHVLPQGISSAPAIFQQMMDSMIQGIPFTGSYLDDALASGKTDKEHLAHLRQIFTRFRNHNYKLAPNKCEFMRDELAFLGHKISKAGLETTTEKVNDVLLMPRPTTITEVKSFLGLPNFYGKFIQDLSTISEPLYNLTRDGVTFQWTKRCEDAFLKIKKQITSTPILAHYDPTKQLGISCDASSLGIGAVLFLLDGNGEEQPIAFASKLLSSAETRYSQIEKEGLSIMFGLDKFFKYLCGRTFILVTDHRPLLKIFGPKTQLPPFVATRLHHWALTLSQFRYTIKYRKTNDHGNADALSRLPNSAAYRKTSAPILEKTINQLAIDQLEILPVAASAVRQATARDPHLSKVMQLILYGWPKELSQEHKDLQPYFTRRNELTILQGVILWGIRVVIPPSLRVRVLNNLHECHFGIVKMKALARQHVYWPGIDADIENVARACQACQQQSANPASQPLHPWQFPETPWQRLHIDLAGEFLGHHWLLVVDAHSKWPEVFCLNKDTTSTSVIRRLTEIFARFGLPEQIVSDNGRQFISAEFEEFCKKNKIKHILSSAYHPRSNGEAERFVRTFKTAMKAMSGSLPARLQKFLLSYRTVPHSTTGSSPADFLLKRRPRTLIDLLRPDTNTTTRTKQANQEIGYNSRVRHRCFPPGTPVVVKTFLKGKKKWSPGRIETQAGPVTYNIKVDDKIMKRHVDHIKAAPPDQPLIPNSPTSSTHYATT